MSSGSGFLLHSDFDKDFFLYENEQQLNANNYIDGNAIVRRIMVKKTPFSFLRKIFGNGKTDGVIQRGLDSVLHMAGVVRDANHDSVHVVIEARKAGDIMFKGKSYAAAVIVIDFDNMGKKMRFIEAGE